MRSVAPIVGGPEAERRRSFRALLFAYGGGLAAALAMGNALRGHGPLLITILADLAATVAVFIFSKGLDNSSVYDPYWSVAPIPIVLYWALLGPGGARAVLLVLLVSVWGMRLTVNQVLRWRGLSHEDFRYAEIRERTGRGYWPVSFLTIHLFPTAWVLLGLLPLYPALSRPSFPFGLLDGVAAAFTACAILLEAAADLQLRRFLRERRDEDEVLAKGVWAYLRHPNYLGEVLFWWGICLFGLAAAPRWWTVAGAVLITALFVFVSVPWMDRHMLARHPSYGARLRTTFALIPWPVRRRA